MPWRHLASVGIPWTGAAASARGTAKTASSTRSAARSSLPARATLWRGRFGGSSTRWRKGPTPPALCSWMRTSWRRTCGKRSWTACRPRCARTTSRSTSRARCPWRPSASSWGAPARARRSTPTTSPGPPGTCCSAAGSCGASTGGAARRTPPSPRPARCSGAKRCIQTAWRQTGSPTATSTTSWRHRRGPPSPPALPTPAYSGRGSRRRRRAISPRRTTRSCRTLAR
mmetsp:Transcript_23951/g.49822  ORF Transcript_23951/g.49822 Transcript_23951/m.49822 type:complete len:228 (-) Transcript_23951:318-1001(-)